MIIIDDILVFPVRSILWIFREISNAAEQEMESEADTIISELSELYMMFETRKITEETFDAREKELLDRLDQIQEKSTSIEEGEDGLYR